MDWVAAGKELERAAERLEEERPDLGVHVVKIGAGRAVSVEVTRQPRSRCHQCGQLISTERPGPVAWVDERTGDVQGGYDHQHGCGEWNQPAAARVELDLGDEQDWDTVLADLAREVDAKAREVRREADAHTRTQLADQLRNALAALAAGDDPEEVATGGETEPGVCQDDAGRWIA